MKAKNRIVRLRKKYPLLHSIDIAKTIGVSKQYVSYILQKNDLITCVPKAKKDLRTCTGCSILHGYNRKFCSNACRFKYTNIEVECSFCHVKFYRKRHVLLKNYRYGYKNIYCSRSCTYRGWRDG